MTEVIISGSERIRAAIRARVESGQKAMGIFVTNGFPDPASTLPIMQAIDESGATFIELGMPFSDPLAEGLPIQRSSARALSHGIKMKDAFSTLSSFRAHSSTPVLLMGYINPIHRYGVQAFCRDAASAGADGLILPDMPLEETSIIFDAALENGLGLVSLIAPTTPDERIERIDAMTTGFVYAVSVAGLTGGDLGDTGAVERYLARAKRLVSNNPLLVGFGIRSRETAAILSRNTDGFIVGSALIEEVERLWDEDGVGDGDRLERLRTFVKGLMPTIAA
jgi:tryptophan synthase alpha chain